MGLFGCLKRRKRGPSASGKRKTFEDKYELLQQIGEGKTGQVFVARHRHAASNLSSSKNAEVAVKIVRMEYLNTPARQEALRQELEILAFVKHPAVLKVFDVFQDEEKIAIVTEKASGGELMDAICNPQRRQNLRECDVVFIMRELLGVLTYLHARGITHRDLKMENVLCKSSTQNISDGILLIDFGLAHKSRKAGVRDMSGMNGTCHYMAPEMFGRDTKYGCEIDLWALGVMTYILLFGCFPFDAKFTSQIEDKIVACDFSFPEDLAPLVSREAKKFIEYLLVVNPHERPPAAMALQHPWLQTADAPAMTQEFSAYHMDKLRRFIEGKKVLSQPVDGKMDAYVPPPIVPPPTPQVN
jgi:serine/threonine protein kinase